VLPLAKLRSWEDDMTQAQRTLLLEIRGNYRLARRLWCTRSAGSMVAGEAAALASTAGAAVIGELSCLAGEVSAPPGFLAAS
jgi:hypothetical protein